MRSIVQQVEQEYGEPFWEIVRGFAADGWGCNTTARILGYSDPVCLRLLIKRHGVQIDWPKAGTCNVQRERGPYDPDRIAKMKASKLAAKGNVVLAFESRTCLSAESEIKRMAETMTKSEVARAIGWGTPQPLTNWLKVRGITVNFVKKKPVPPRKKGWQANPSSLI